jgi:CHAD domain-containing protein
VKARQKARRRLVKILDRRDVQDVVRRETPKSLSAFALTHSVRPRVWKRQTRMRIAARAATAIAAVDRSDAVYLPNRAHTARIALKKLRYAVEIAATTGLWPEPTPLKELRRAQASLGEVHDRQVLLDRLKGLHVPDESSHLTALGDLIRFDIEHEFQRYRARLDRLRAAIDECAVWSRPVIRPAIRRPLVALPLASLPLAAALIAPMLSPPRSAR